MDEIPSIEPSSGLPRPLKIGILVVLVCLVVIAAGIFLALRLRKSGSTTNTATSSVETSNQAGQPNAAQPSPIRSLQDSDGDRLGDQEEASLGTNPNSTDTDGDGLFDYEEAKIYHSNPLNPDTDGDGVNDGAEARGGTNPLGSGDSRNLNAAIANTNRSTNQ